MCKECKRRRITESRAKEHQYTLRSYMSGVVAKKCDVSETRLLTLWQQQGGLCALSGLPMIYDTPYSMYSARYFQGSLVCRQVLVMFEGSGELTKQQVVEFCAAVARKNNVPLQSK